jgi:hypothetical protein
MKDTTLKHHNRIFVSQPRSFFHIDDIIAVCARPVVAVRTTSAVLIVPLLLFHVDDIIAVSARPVVAVRATTSVLIMTPLFFGCNDRRPSIVGVRTWSILAVGGGGIRFMPFVKCNVCDFWDSWTLLACPPVRIGDEIETYQLGQNRLLLRLAG